MGRGKIFRVAGEMAAVVEELREKTQFKLTVRPQPHFWRSYSEDREQALSVHRNNQRTLNQGPIHLRVDVMKELEISTEHIAQKTMRLRR